MRYLWPAHLRSFYRPRTTVAFSTHVQKFAQPINSGTRNGRAYFNEICDVLWQCRRGSLLTVDRKLMIMDAPRLTMQCRGWREFVDDGLVHEWTKQALRKDVLAFLKPEARLADMLLEMAKVLNAAKDDNFLCITNATATQFHRLIDEMIERVFVRRRAGFKHISVATESLARYRGLLKAPSDTVESWTNIINQWIASGRLTTILESFLNGHMESNIGLTSLAQFMGSLARLKCKPPEEVMRLLAAACLKIFTAPPEHTLTTKALIEYFRAWHTWFVNPETLCPGSWSSWFGIYERTLTKRPIVNMGQIKNLMSTAFVLAKDFNQVEHLIAALPTTACVIDELHRAEDLRYAHVQVLLDNINKLKEVRNISDNVSIEDFIEKLNGYCSNS